MRSLLAPKRLVRLSRHNKADLSSPVRRLDSRYCSYAVHTSDDSELERYGTAVGALVAVCRSRNRGAC